MPQRASYTLWLARITKTSVAMVVSCCAFGCSNRYGQKKGLGFYRFPTLLQDRRQKWIQAVKRENWTPSNHSRICGSHFVSGITILAPCSNYIVGKLIYMHVLVSIGKPVNRANHVDYVPTIFVHTSAVTPVKVALIEECEKRVLKRRM